jgi:hypothetical protein
MSKKSRTDDERLYLVCLFLLPVILLVGILYRTGLFVPSRYLPPCMFHVLTGLSCPGCGCTRAVTALLRGDLWLSIRCNPSILCLTLFYIIFFGKNTLARGSRLLAKKAPALQREGNPFHMLTQIRELRFRPLYVYLFVALFVCFGAIRLIIELWLRLS